MSLSQIGFLPTRALADRSFLSGSAAFALVTGSAVFATVLWLPLVLADPDTLWHVTVGNWILAHGAVPSVDVYSFTAEGRPWAAQEWLSEVSLALVYRLGGWTGVMILSASALASVTGVLAFYLRRHLRADFALALVALAFACATPSLLARPHLIALPCLAIWTVGLISARGRGGAPPFILLPVMTLWANLHGGFMAGLVLAGALAVEAAFDPVHRDRAVVLRWGAFVLGAVTAAAINPHGVDGLLFPFRLMAMKDLGQIQEWQPANMGQLSGITGTVLLGLYLGLTGQLHLPRFRVLLLIGLVFATMQHVRNSQVFGVMAPLLIAGSFASAAVRPLPPVFVRLERALSGVMALAALVSLSARIALPLHRTDEVYYASAGLAHVPADLRAKPVLNEYGFGGQLIFAGIRPFIDGRADLYGDAGMDAYFDIVHDKGNALDAALCQYRIGWTMFSPASEVPPLLDRTPGWHRLYADKVVVIHARDPGTPFCPAQAAK